MIKAAVGAAIVVAVLVSTTPTSADHDKVYAPCDPEDPRPLYERVWYLDYQSGEALRFDDPWWSERVGGEDNSKTR